MVQYAVDTEGQRLTRNPGCRGAPGRHYRVHNAPQLLLVEALGHARMPFAGVRPDHRAGIELAVGYQLASIIAGGPAPIIATWLFATFHSSVPIALYILLLAIIGIIATSMLTDYTNKDISAEYAGV
jgi:hypothetical protein